MPIAAPAPLSQLIAPIITKTDTALARVCFFIAANYIDRNFFFKRLEMIFVSVILISLTGNHPRAESARTALDPFRTIVSCGALIFLGTTAYWSARLGWADHISRRPDLASREHAVALAPFSSIFHQRLAEKRAESGL